MDAELELTFPSQNVHIHQHLGYILADHLIVDHLAVADTLLPFADHHLPLIHMAIGAHALTPLVSITDSSQRKTFQCLIAGDQLFLFS